MDALAALRRRAGPDRGVVGASSVIEVRVNAMSQLRAVRIVLAIGTLLRAIAWGLGAAFTLFVGAALIDLITPLSLGTRHAIVGVAAIGGLAIAGSLFWRDRSVLSLERVAMWVEERVPSLEYTLVTAVETGNASFIAGVKTDRWRPIALRRSARALRAPTAVAIAAIVALLLMPGGAVARMTLPRAGDSIDRTSTLGRSSASRLTPLVAEVIPPRYSGQRESKLDEPRDVRALVGSALTIAGRGDANGIVARMGKDSLAATQRGDRWSIALAVPTKPFAIRLTDRTFERIVAIEPILDASPSVVLNVPAHDSVLRTPTGRIPLAAHATDDLGLVSAAFEYIVSSGEGETFKFKSGTVGVVKPTGKSATLASAISLDSLRLKAGDIVHVRAVARDANDVSGPGIGVSETRTIRIARADEYDSVAVDAAGPADEEKSVISERMLIMLAEALQKRRPSLRRDTVVSESRRIAVDQKRLRRTVGDVVFTRLGGDPSGEEHTDDESPTRAKTMEEMLARADSATNRSTDPLDFEGDESPVVAVNKPLLEAYNAMWSASTELEVGEPGRALPHMRRALEAIERARKAERLYLRGAPPAVVIDVSKARLKGKDKGSNSERRALSPADSAAHGRLLRFANIVDLIQRDQRAAIDSLLVLRIDALADEPSFASALSDAADAMRRGKAVEASNALTRARRVLAGPTVARDSLARWSIVP
jgi:hypothetical protein